MNDMRERILVLDVGLVAPPALRKLWYCSTMRSRFTSHRGEPCPYPGDAPLTICQPPHVLPPSLLVLSPTLQSLRLSRSTPLSASPVNAFAQRFLPQHRTAMWMLPVFGLWTRLGVRILVHCAISASVKTYDRGESRCVSAKTSSGDPLRHKSTIVTRRNIIGRMGIIAINSERPRYLLRTCE